EVTCGCVVDLDSGGFRERVRHLDERILLATTPQREHFDGSSFMRCGLRARRCGKCCRDGCEHDGQQNEPRTSLQLDSSSSQAAASRPPLVKPLEADPTFFNL